MASAAWAGDAPAPLWHKICAEKGGPCRVEQFAVSMPGKVVVLHIRFDA